MTVVCGSEESAADAVQSAFFKAHVRWHRLSGYEDPLSWIRRVAINELRDEARRFGSTQRAVDRLRGQPRRSVDAPAEPGSDWLRTLLAELPRQQRTTIALHYIEELSVTEVARTLRLSEGAVSYHLSRGRERLRGVLLERGDLR